MTQSLRERILQAVVALPARYQITYRTLASDISQQG